MQHSRRQQRLLAEINIVPYIDVMLVLLVIFMVTAPLLHQGVKVSLPKTSARQLKQSKEPIIVTVNQKGRYFLNINARPNKAINGRILVNRIAAELRFAKQHGEQKKVLVRGDQKASYGEVVQAMTLLQKAGARELGLLTSPNKKG